MSAKISDAASNICLSICNLAKMAKNFSLAAKQQLKTKLRCYSSIYFTNSRKFAR